MPCQSCTAGPPHSTEDIPTRNPILLSSIAESPKRQSNRDQKRGRKPREVDVFSPSPSLSTSSSSSSSPSSPTPSRDSRRRFPMSIPKKPILKPFFLIFLSFFLFFHLFLSSKKAPDSPSSSSAAAAATTPPLIRIRPGFRSYDDYIKLQLNKTLNPRLRRVWATRDWDRKVRVFARFFSELKAEGLLTNASAALCVGARLGQEVAALRGLGVAGALGMDLVPAPPLVVAGDFHAQPFPDDYFDFEFSNVFDHALYPERFVAEVERTLRPGGVAVLHVAVHRRGDKYSANDLLGGVDGLVALFKRSELVRVRKVDGFGLDTEVVLRKKQTEKMKKKKKNK